MIVVLVRAVLWSTLFAGSVLMFVVAPPHGGPAARRAAGRYWQPARARRDIKGRAFADEFDQAMKVLALLPGAGISYPQAGVDGLRRIYVPKVACHLYYTFAEAEVIVWGPRRGHGPRLNP